MNRTLVFAALLISATPVFADATPPAAVPIEASYSLPFSRDLSSVLNYSLDDPTWEPQANGVVFLEYTLPADLIGREKERMVMFTESPIKPTDTFFHLICGRTNSEASCTRSHDRVVCAVTFRNLDIDSVQVSTLLDTKYGLSDSLKLNRKNAASTFARDAVGTLLIDFQK